MDSLIKILITSYCIWKASMLYSALWFRLVCLVTKWYYPAVDMVTSSILKIDPIFSIFFSQRAISSACVACSGWRIGQEWLPETHVFGILAFSWWNCLRRIRRYSLFRISVSLEADWGFRRLASFTLSSVSSLHQEDMSSQHAVKLLLFTNRYSSPLKLWAIKSFLL